MQTKRYDCCCQACRYKVFDETCQADEMLVLHALTSAALVIIIIITVVAS